MSKFYNKTSSFEKKSIFDRTPITNQRDYYSSIDMILCFSNFPILLMLVYDSAYSSYLYLLCFSYNKIIARISHIPFRCRRGYMAENRDINGITYINGSTDKNAFYALGYAMPLIECGNLSSAPHRFR